MCELSTKFDGVSSSGDELWVNRKNESIAVGDMSEAHAKNALRSLLKNLRERRARLATSMMDSLNDDCSCESLDDDCCIA